MRDAQSEQAVMDDTRTVRRDPIPNDLSPLPAERFGIGEARHLLLRAGFGGTGGQVRTLATWGLDDAVDHLVEYDDIEWPDAPAEDFSSSIMREPTQAERRTYRQALRAGDEDVLARFRTRRQSAQRADRTQIREMQRWWLRRMIETPRPLEEKLTLFWHGHLPSSYRTIENSYHQFAQNQFLRTNAAGSFATLLHGIVRDPAMLAYLDQNDSRKDEPNETLARELMELFGLGRGNYSEQDIKQGARALTGHTFVGNEFVFDRNNHDAGTKTIFGRRGDYDGAGVVDLILGRRECAELIARKLYGYFVADLPPIGAELPRHQRGAIRELATLLRRSRYELRPALHRLFRSAHFYHADVMGTRIKGPADLTVGAIRTFEAPPRSLAVLIDAMDLMGQHLFQPPSVKGWDGGRAWINTSTMYVRQNLLTFLLTGAKPEGYQGDTDDALYDPTRLLADLAQVDPAAARDTGSVVDYLLALTLAAPAPGARERLAEFIDTHGGPRPDVVTGALLLITALPEYQLC